MQRRRYQRQEVIFQQDEVGDTVHLIEKGCALVEAYVGHGAVAVLSVRWPGEIIGELAVVGNGRRSARVTALEPTETLLITQKTLAEIRTLDPNVDRLFLNALITKLSETTEQYLDMMFAPVQTRVMRVLLRLVSSVSTNSCPLALRIRQRDIAAMVGSSRQTVNQILKRAENAGVIYLERGSITIFDLPRLKHLAR